VQLEIKELYFW